MEALAKAQLLMNELGPVFEPLAIQFSPEENCWGVLFDEDLLVLVEVDDEQDKMVLSSELGELGELPQVDRLGLYELLLAYNVQWQVTGGGRLGVNGPQASVVLLFDLFVQELDISRLGNALASFVETALAWRKIVQSPDSMQSALAESPGELGIRV